MRNVLDIVCLHGHGVDRCADGLDPGVQFGVDWRGDKTLRWRTGHRMNPEQADLPAAVGDFFPAVAIALDLRWRGCQARLLPRPLSAADAPGLVAVDFAFHTFILPHREPEKNTAMRIGRITRTCWEKQKRIPGLPDWLLVWRPGCSIVETQVICPFLGCTN